MFPFTRNGKATTDVGRLGYANRRHAAVWIARQGSAWNDMLDAQNARSLDTLSRLSGEGKVKAYPSGTKVEVIRTMVFSRKVVIAEGEDAGDMGWVQFEFVQSLAWTPAAGCRPGLPMQESSAAIRRTIVTR